MLRLADFFMRLEARLSYALIGLVQATGYAGGLDYLLLHGNMLARSALFQVEKRCAAYSCRRKPEQ